MLVGVPKETFPGERRVALVPAVLPNLKKAGVEVAVQSGAGAEAGYPDAAYADKGARIAAGARRRVPAGGRCAAGPGIRIQRQDGSRTISPCSGPVRR